MNPAQLLSHFNRITEAPNTIPRLRQFIFDLAVRGKLSEQDLKDDPAPRLLGVREIFPSTDSQPWPLPSGWAWSSFAQIGETLGGGTPTKANPDFWNGSIPWVSPKDMKVDLIEDTQDHISKLAIEQSSTRAIPTGSLLVVVRGMILAHSFPTALSAVPVTINQDMKAIVPFRTDLARMLLLLTKGLKPAVLRLVQRATHGTCKLLTDDLFSMPIPIPPLPEQHRIVAKVDELMKLCDDLEAAQKEREDRRNRLAAASLARLNQPADDVTEFREHARFHLRHLPRMTTRPEQIKRLRQTLLNLAVRGMLVPQHAHDEPASNLLERIQADIRSYAARNRVPIATVDVIDGDTIPYLLPKGWIWARLAWLCRVVTDGDHLPPPRSERGVAFLTIGNVSAGELDFTACRRVPQEYFDKIATYRRPESGDLLYTVVGATYGRPVLVEVGQPFCVQRHIAILKPAEGVLPKYLHRLLGSPPLYQQASRCLTGAAQPTIPLRPLRNFMVPLPPLAQQSRIVAKVDELMALCDQLEAHLFTAETESQRLLESVLHEALHQAA